MRRMNLRTTAKHNALTMPETRPNSDLSPTFSVYGDLLLLSSPTHKLV